MENIRRRNGLFWASLPRTSLIAPWMLGLKRKRLLKPCESFKEKTSICYMDCAPAEPHIGNLSRDRICRCVEVARTRDFYPLTDVYLLVRSGDSVPHQVGNPTTGSRSRCRILAVIELHSRPPNARPLGRNGVEKLRFRRFE